MGSTSTSRCSRPATSRCRDAGEQARRPSAGPLRILFIADVFGAPGRRVLETRLPRLRDELDIDFCIVNGENAADGSGITRRLAARIAEAGADVITTGNHV
ncbi:MAG: YmdB family metallophosphoesterase, partial [Gaiellales bacterium]